MHCTFYLVYGHGNWKKKKNNVSSLHEESLIPKDYGPLVFFFSLTEYASILLSFNFEA
jgi:hypothetical protein